MSRSIIALAGLLGVWTGAAGAQEGLPKEALAILQNAKEIEVLSLDPRVRDAKGFHNYKVIGKTAVKDEATRKKVVAALVKAVNEAGGYGMLMGPTASRKERAEFRERVRADPRNYIAQPRIELSSCPTWTRQGVQPRRVDLRPFVVTGETSWVLPGGLTRVALVKGSYVVNSSQGGGSKDTWIAEPSP